MKRVRALIVAASTLVPPLPGQMIVSDPKGLVRIEIPKGWAVKNPKYDDVGKLWKGYDVISFEASVGLADIAEIYVTVIHPTHLRPLAQAWYEGTSPGSNADAERIGIYKDPVPHVVWIDKRRSSLYRVVAFRRIRTRGLHVTLYCPEKHWPSLKPAFFRLVESAKVRYEPWLKPNEKRELKMVDGVGFSANHGVGKAEFMEVQKFFAEVIDRLEKVHGPRWREPSEPLTVHVSSIRTEHREFDGAEEEQSNVMGSALHNRILTVPLGSDAVRRDFATLVAAIFLTHTYGQTAEWMLDGEQLIATITAGTGRKLPYVTSEYHRTIVPTAMTLKQLLEPNALVAEARWSHLVSYIALFHTGPRVYRKAYKAFLSELRETCDGESALKRHLLALDQEKMRKAAAAITKRMKVPKMRPRR